jgi:hypothetical protein
MGLVGPLTAPLLQGVPQALWWAWPPPQGSGSLQLALTSLFRAAGTLPRRTGVLVRIRLFCRFAASRSIAGQPACLRKVRAASGEVDGPLKARGRDSASLWGLSGSSGGLD